MEEVSDEVLYTRLKLISHNLVLNLRHIVDFFGN